MSWNGSNPNAPSWTGSTTGAGNEELYIIPNPPNTTTNPSIGIVDGNLIPLPTSYNTLNVDTLNSTSINNSGNINTATINGHSADASAWSTFPAIQDVGMANYSLNNANTLNANTSVNIGTLTTGGSLNVGQYDANPTSAPSVTIGNPVLNKCSVDVYGLNNTVGFGAMTVNGGFTVGAGTLHGVKMTCDSAVSLDAVRFNMDAVNGISLLTLNPAQPIQNISLDSIKQIKTRSVLGTIVASQTGLYVTQLATTGYDGGRVFTDKISPGYSGTNPLTINGNVGLTGSTKTGVIIEDGINISSDNFNAKSLYYLNKSILYPLPFDYGTSYDRGALVTYTDGIAYWSNGNFNAGHIPPSSPTWWYPANYVSGRTYYDPQNAILNNIVYKCTSTIGTTVAPPDSGYWIVASTTTIGKWDFGYHKQGIRFNSLFSNVFNTFVQKEGSLVPSWITTTEFTNTITDTASSNFVLSPAMEDFNLSGYNITNCNTLSATTVNATNLNVSGAVITPEIDATFVTLPQTTQQPPNWSSNPLRRYNQYAYVFNGSDAGGDNLNYFATISNEDVRPDTDTPGTWYLAAWDTYTTYLTGQPIYWNYNFYISLQDGNTGNYPSDLGAWWETTNKYTNGYVDAGIQFLPIEGDTSITMITKRGSRGSGEMPQDISINTKSLTNVELTNTIIVQSPMYRQFDMGQQDIVKCPNLLNDAGNITISTDYDMALNTNRAVGAITMSSGSNISLNGANSMIAGGIDGTIGIQTGSDINVFAQNGGSITLSTGFEPADSSTAQNINITSRRNIEITNTDGDHITISANNHLNLEAIDITVDAPIDMGGQVITNCPSLTSSTSLDLTASSGAASLTSITGNVVLTPQAGSVISANGKLDMTNHTITGANTILGSGSIGIDGHTNVEILADTGYCQINAALGGTTVAAHTDINITSSTGSINLNTPNFIFANNTLDMGGNDIINCPSIRYPYYGRFYNNANQTLSGVSTNEPVNWTNAENNLGITITGGNKLVIANAGKYLVTWSVWLYHGSGFLTQTLMFLRLNGTTFVPYSCQTAYNSATLNESQLSQTNIINVAAGDQLQLMWQAQNTNTSIVATAPVGGVNGFPGIPSATITITSI